MILDAVLADRHYAWLGTERDKMQYFFSGLLKEDLPKDWYPHLTSADRHGTTPFRDGTGTPAGTVPWAQAT
jgi:hypothetical protein